MLKKLPKILYNIKTIMIILIIIINITFLPIILDLKTMGILYLIVFSIFIIITLMTYLTKSKMYKKNIYYNLIYISLGLYLILIKCRIAFNYRLATNLYEVDINYFKINFLIILIVLIGIIINTLILSFKKR
ncbi:MAG: hypothetical protein RSE91_02710 [Bacilli bacterium]